MTTKTVRAVEPNESRPRMNTELFGVFGDLERFERYRSEAEFDRVVSGERVTVGVRDDGLDVDGRSSVAETEEGCCAIWGELITPADVSRPGAEWLLERVLASGPSAFEELNGSYVAVVEWDGRAVVIPDLLRSRECFYADVDGTRVFGTDAAAIARLLDSPTVDGVGLNHHLHFGVVLEDRTILRELRRLPFDASLTETRTDDLGRLSYRVVERDDYAADLADRLRDAVRRRSSYPGKRGLLASAGFDSRLLMANVPDLDVSYTLGTPSTPEVIVARKLAAQYGVDHQLLPVTEGYLNTDPEIVQYTNGIRESVHIHHRGNDDQLAVDTIYHGLLLDTVLRDIYLPRRTVDLFGHPLPLPGLESDPDVFDSMKTRLDIYTERETLLAECSNAEHESTKEFLEREITAAIDDCRSNADSTYNAMALLGLKLKQALPFKTHLADNYYESLVAADADIIEWHLTTPPRRRNSRTFQRALELVDDDLLRHRPPDRPHRSHLFNQVEGFLRRNLPVVESAGTPWPDRDRIYEENDMDRKLFPDSPAVHELPPRVKLRINDALTWLECATGRVYRPDDVLRLE